MEDVKIDNSSKIIARAELLSTIMSSDLTLESKREIGKVLIEEIKSFFYLEIEQYVIKML